MKLRYLVIALTLLAAFASNSWGRSQEPPKQAPEVKSEQKPDSGLKPEQPAEHHEQGTPNTPAAVPEVLADSRDRKCRSDCPDAEQEGTEFWPPFHSYRLKVTDTLVAAFTALLFVATIALWWSTRRLVRGADETARKQLRAYVGIECCQVITKDLGNTFVVEVRIKNAGETPARDVHHFITAEILTPFGERLEFNPPGRNMGIVPLAPGMSHVLETPIAIGGPAGVPSIEASRRAIFTWGRVNYWDVFGKEQHVMFRFRSGEPIREHNGTVMQTVGWRMTAEDQGNSAS